MIYDLSISVTNVTQNLCPSKSFSCNLEISSLGSLAELFWLADFVVASCNSFQDFISSLASFRDSIAISGFEKFVNYTS